jgi:hypothetical protein
MSTFDLHEADEIVVLRRKINVIEENGEKKEVRRDDEISRVRVPYDLTIIGGMIDVNWETTQRGSPNEGEAAFKDQRFFVIKYLTR